MDAKPTKPDMSAASFYKFGKVAGADETGKGVSIGQAETSEATGGQSTPVKVDDKYAKYLREDWKKSGA